MRTGILMTFLLLAVIIISLPALGSGSVSGYSVVVVEADGSVVVEYRLTIAGIPSNVTLKVPAGALMVYVEAGGEPVPYTYNESGGLLSFIALYDSVRVRVYTQTLTSKEDGLWTLNMGLVEFETMLSLPKDSLLVSIEPQDFTVKIVNGTPYMAFKAGSHIRVEYIIIPTTITTTPIITQTETTTPITPVPVAEEKLRTLLIIIIAILAVLAITAIILYRTRKAKAGLIAETMVEELDTRDKEILNTIASMGEATASDIQRATGIPKTPLYRKLEKLEKLGHLESELRGGVRVYKTRKH